jgi:hypothetical protein
MDKNNEQNQPSLSPEEELELQKLRMKAKFGSLFGGSSGSLPPEAELEWLKHIEKFEDVYGSEKRITVREILGDLVIEKPQGLAEDQLDKELHDLLDKMAERGIALDILCETPADVIFDFIINELLPYETDDMRGTGFTTHFTYEEFHPNAEYDIDHVVDDFVTGLCSIEFYDHIKYYLNDQVCDHKDVMISREEMMEKIKPFGEAFEKPNIKQWEVKKLEINDEKTEAEFDVDLKYTVKSKDTGKNTVFSGIASFLVVKDDLDYWGIRKFSIPGLVV